MIIPQKGFQEKFLSSPAQIVIGGGSAGGGKTYALLMEALRYSHLPQYGAVIFRRTTPQIKNQGGLWDTSNDLFRNIPDSPKAKEFNLTWQFKAGGKLKFSHLQYESDKYSFQGSQIPLIGFDELTHFSEEQFFYLLSRNRSTGFAMPSYIRATCNPDSNSWVKRFVSWWIYPDDYPVETLQGMPVPERDGVLRYFVRDGNEYIWGDTKKEVIEKAPHVFNKKLLQSLLEAKMMPETLVKSATYIFGDVYGNKKLLGSDPAYLSNLLSQDEVEKNKLLKGCWKHVEDEYKMFSYMSVQDLFSNDFAASGQRYLTCDIALEGSDLFVIGVWDGWRLVDIIAIEKSDGKAVLEQIKSIASKYSIPQSCIIYDADGVGGYIKGFLPNARPFVNGSKALKGNYDNLKTECYFEISKMVEKRAVFVAHSKFRDLLVQELDSIKKKPHDGFSKLKMSSKAEVKIRIGRSPDFADMFCMRYYAELLPKRSGGKISTF